MRLHAFNALRPAPELVARIVSPPYDVVSRSEARALARDNPLSFLRVVRSDIDLPDDVDAHDARVYAKARENLEWLIAEHTLMRDGHACLYLYRQVMEGRAQVGVVGCVHVDDDGGVIKKHETTRPDKEDDRTQHILTLDAQAEPVLLAYRGRADLDQLVGANMKMRPLYELTTADGVRHTAWRVADPAPLVGAFEQVPGAYIADGHHRTAGARRAARQRRGETPGRGDDAESEWFLAVLVPAEQLRILPYNRVISDLVGQAPGEVLGQLEKIGRLSRTADPVPPRPGSFCLYLDRRWYRLELAEASIDRTETLRSLDVALLHARVLAPVLGIGDERTDQRIDFVGGGRGTRQLEARVDSGEAALAVSMYPTTMAELMAVADAGHVMPPKSTWFEPKLLSGLFVHTLDGGIV